MKVLDYEVWWYDVWGNEEDGWEVNDRSCHNRHLIIESAPKTYNQGTQQQFTDFVPTDQEILDNMIRAGGMSACVELEDIEIEGDDLTHYINDAKNGRPLCELVLNNEKKGD